jgi:hypothetical protein
MGRVPDAEAAAREGLAMREKVGSGLGLGLRIGGFINEAEKLATDCLESAKHMSGPAAERNSFVASCHSCLGEVLREMGRLPDAEAAAREGLAMREKVGS